MNSKSSNKIKNHDIKFQNFVFNFEKNISSLNILTIFVLTRWDNSKASNYE